jgi:ABC-type Na+ efflux pump permease subunit
LIGGPLVVRELLTLPRHARHFGLRAGYVAALCVLIYTGAQTTSGLAPLRSIGDISGFGAYIFSVVCTVQLALVLGASLLFSAGNVAQEKDRRTLILLLMTDLSSPELVLGKSLASVLPVLVLILVSFPVLCCLRILGGITLTQILWVEVLCLISCLAASAWGTLVGYWREKTFQILAVSFLGAGLFVGLAETVFLVLGDATPWGRFAGDLDPFRSLNQVLHPLTAFPRQISPTGQAWGGLIAMSAATGVFWIWTIWMVRIWNPSRSIYVAVEDESAGDVEDALSPSRSKSVRPIWELPIIWREICTQAYGRKVGIVKIGYFLFAAFCLVWLSRLRPDATLAFGAVSGMGLIFVLLSLVCLVLVNAQAVTSMTSERDGQTLELLLVTEVTAREFVFGKLGGILFNTKEVIAVPLLLVTMSFLRGEMALNGLICTWLGFVTLVLFSAMLGLHAGLSFTASRAAILNSLGTVFFLFIGVFVCMMLIVEARTSFILQLIPFLIFILGGSLGLWMSLMHQNPSPALQICAWSLPFLTFYAIVSFLLNDTPAVCAAVLAAYGFTTLSMLIPAVSAFDVALGRATVDRG